MCPEVSSEFRVSSFEFEYATRNAQSGTRNPERGTAARARGFSIVAAIFLLVVLALLGAAIVYVTGLQQSGHQLDILGARAYQAARAGIEWTAFQVLDPNNTQGAAVAPCPDLTPQPLLAGSLAGSLAPFTVTLTCNQVSTSEGNRTVAVYRVTSIACNASPCPNATPAPGYVERELQATLSKCKDPTAEGPRFACN